VGLVLRYSLLVDAYEKIEATTKRLEMTDHLVDLIKQTPTDVIDKVTYLTQGKLYPDFEGIEIGIAEKLAIRVLSMVSGHSEQDVTKEYKKSGDLGSASFNLLKKRVQQALFREPLSVEHVYDALDRIARASGAGSVELKMKLLASLLNDATPREAKYIVRTALGNLRLGVADMTILDGLANAIGGGKESREEVERAYNLSSDLGYVARVLAENGIEGVKRFRVTVGRPIRPMLAERLDDAEEILSKLGGEGSAEYKYDGLRMQIHISPKTVRLFSRRLENITEQFPDVCAYVKESFRSKEAILEGESVAVDPNTGDMLPFQMVSQRRGRKYDIERMREEVPVTVFLFDLLYANGKDFTVRPYPERREELKRLIRETERVKISNQTTVDAPEELDAYMSEAVSQGCEGLMVKSTAVDSFYKAGARGWAWVKYKRSYKAEVADTFDLVPVGALMGRGKRAGSYGALLMAAYRPEDDTFETVCKLGTGFTDVDLEQLPEKFAPYVSQHKHARVTSLLEADVWFVPSFVLEISADEITLSPLHTCGRDTIRKGSGLALRFPRFTGNWRTDKSPEDATTDVEIVEMYKSQLKKIGPAKTSEGAAGPQAV